MQDPIHTNDLISRSDVPEEAERDDVWRWRSLRRFGIGVEVWPLNWYIGAFFDADRHGGNARLQIGPLDLVFHFNNGSF